MILMIHLALTPHPQTLGSALTNQWITTDFSESLLEFITPVSNDVDVLLNQLKDVHHFTMTKMGMRSCGRCRCRVM